MIIACLWWTSLGYDLTELKGHELIFFIASIWVCLLPAAYITDLSARKNFNVKNYETKKENHGKKENNGY